MKHTLTTEERLLKRLDQAMNLFGAACWTCGLLVGGMVVYIFLEAYK